MQALEVLVLQDFRYQCQEWVIFAFVFHHKRCLVFCSSPLNFLQQRDYKTVLLVHTMYHQDLWEQNFRTQLIICFAIQALMQAIEHELEVTVRVHEVRSEYERQMQE